MSVGLTDPFITQIIIGAVFLFGTCVGLFVLERFGRRRPLILVRLVYGPLPALADHLRTREVFGKASGSLSLRLSVQQRIRQVRSLLSCFYRHADFGFQAHPNTGKVRDEHCCTSLRVLT